MFKLRRVIARWAFSRRILLEPLYERIEVDSARCRLGSISQISSYRFDPWQKDVVASDLCFELCNGVLPEFALLVDIALFPSEMGE
jgi:hypothetical protein